MIKQSRLEGKAARTGGEVGGGGRRAKVGKGKRWEKERGGERSGEGKGKNRKRGVRE